MSSKLSVQQIAKMEGVNDETVRRWIATGALPAYQYPGSGKEPIIRVVAADLAIQSSPSETCNSRKES